MDRKEFSRIFPRLYHMAHHQALPSILRHGLLSTSSLLDLFEIKGADREALESRMRPRSVPITHPVHGMAVVRDQKPIMSDVRLAQALDGSATPAEFHRLLNGKVFFWVTSDRLKTLRNAAEYRAEPQLVLTLDTEKLVAEFGDLISLCPMNSGACKPFAHPRTPAIFQPIEDYDFPYWKRRKGGAEKSVVECTVERGVYDVSRFIVETEFVGGGENATHRN